LSYAHLKIVNFVAKKKPLRSVSERPSPEGLTETQKLSGVLPFQISVRHPA